MFDLEPPLQARPKNTPSPFVIDLLSFSWLLVGSQFCNPIFILQLKQDDLLLLESLAKSLICIQWTFRSLETSIFSFSSDQSVGINQFVGYNLMQTNSKKPVLAFISVTIERLIRDRLQDPPQP